VNPDPQSQLDTATAFFLAGERCSLEVRFGQYGFHTVSAPTIVNYALSVELSLKLIHLLAVGASVRGHDLEALFRALPEESRANLPHLEECVAEIARYFEDWRYPFERELLFGDFDNPRRAFVECCRETRRLRPTLVSIYEQLWEGFEPEWLQTWPTDHPRWELRLIRA
jgi:HEPN domain-containing protein